MPETPWRIPARIETERLIVRRYEATDAEDMSRVTAASKDYLAPWLPWARDEPLDAHERAQLLTRFMSEFDECSEFAMGIFLKDTREYIGGTGFHTRLGPGILEIGYWIAADRQRNGYVTEAAVTLTQVGLDYAGAERVEIHHLPRNLLSRAVPERAGYTYERRAETVMPGVAEFEATDIWVATDDNLREGLLAATPRPSLFTRDSQPLAWPG